MMRSYIEIEIEIQKSLCVSKVNRFAIRIPKWWKRRTRVPKKKYKQYTKETHKFKNYVKNQNRIMKFLLLELVHIWNLHLPQRYHMPCHNPIHFPILQTHTHTRTFTLGYINIHSVHNLISIIKSFENRA